MAQVQFCNKPKPRRVFDAINTNEWKVLDEIWGYSQTQTHGGVIDDNVTFDNEGNLVLIANGDWYVGDKQGIVDTSDISVTGGQRTGSAIQSTQTYGPGSFEVDIKFPSFNGICTAMWLYNYRDNGDGTHNNWEIDIEVHGTTSGNVGNYQTPLFTTWTTEQSNTSNYVDIGYSLADGKFHRMRIDWHTGENPRVEYYVDGVLWCTQTTNVPTNQMYFTIGCWFPNGWCGEPNFETDFALVKGFRYTPFAAESATTYNCGTISSGGWQQNVQIPTKNLVANGSFDNDFAKYQNLQPAGETYAWSVTDSNATIFNGQITFDGTLTQLVTVDCLGETFVFCANGSGSGTVKITYQSIVDGVTINQSVTIPLNVARQFTPPANCTQLKIEIVSSGSLTLSDVTLKVVC